VTIIDFDCAIRLEQAAVITLIASTSAALEDERQTTRDN
jgi:hypothetical protein